MKSTSPRDIKVQQFLQELSLTDPGKHEIIEELRRQVFSLHPKIEERMMYGGILFSLTGEDFGGLFAYKKHVSMEFSNGYKLDDPGKTLEGSGKFRRHLKFYEGGEIREKKARYYLEQAISLLSE